MAERSAKATWKTKRRQRESAARMRELKKTKLSSPMAAHSSSTIDDPSTPSDSSAPARPAPDPSKLHSDDDHFSPSKSKNERDDRSDVSSGSDDSDFDNEKAQVKLDDWVVSLPLYNRKMLAVMLMETLQKRMKIGSTQAAWITRFNEKTVQTYRKEFFERSGKFRDEARGKYTCTRDSVS